MGERFICIPTDATTIRDDKASTNKIVQSWSSVPAQQPSEIGNLRGDQFVLNKP